MKRCDKPVSEIEGNTLGKFEKAQDEHSWHLFIPCGYTHVEKELQDNNHIFSTKKDGWVLGIEGADNFAAKDRVWNMLLKRYGRLRATIYMPETWVTHDPEQMEDFKNKANKKTDLNKNALYIMKKNIQQQQGLHLFTDPAEADGAFGQGYVVIQRVLTDPYIINGRKINLRLYVLLVCNSLGKKMYVYDDGFIYYSKALYKSGTIRDEVITTGYISREIYRDNPLTTKDFYKFVYTKEGPAAVERFIQARDYILKGFMEAAKDDFCTGKSDVTFAQSFGIDLQPNSDLSDVKILEWNKGQSLEIMDMRDGELKQKMIDDIYRTLGIVSDGVKSGYHLLWTS